MTAGAGSRPTIPTLGAVIVKPGDVNEDGVVDQTDWDIANAHSGQSFPLVSRNTPRPGTRAMSILTASSARKISSSSTTTSRSPASLLLLALGIMGVRRRRKYSKHRFMDKPGKTVGLARLVFGIG